MNCPFCHEHGIEVPLRFTQDAWRAERVLAHCYGCGAQGRLEAPYDKSGKLTEQAFTGVISVTQNERITFRGQAKTWEEQQP